MNNLTLALHETDEVGTVSLFNDHSLPTSVLHDWENNHPTSHGGSRFVIDFGDVVLKLPHHYDQTIELGRFDNLYEIFMNGDEAYSEDNFDGFDQMVAEWLVWETCPEDYRHLLCPIVDYGFLENGVPYTVMKKAKTYSDWGDRPEDEAYHSATSETSRPSYVSSSQGSWYEEAPDLKEFLQKQGVDTEELSYDELEGMCDVCGIDSGDFFNNYSNVGTIDGEIVMIDYGWGLVYNGAEKLKDISIESILQRQQVVY